MSNDVMTKLTFMTIKACQDGVNFWAATGAIEAAAQAQGWDLDEKKTWADWDDEDE